MISVKLDHALLDELEQFRADRNGPPRGRMAYDDAINVIVKDWLLGQGYVPLSEDGEEEIIRMMDADNVSKG